jgi:methanogenic corrinoid protein MtbC1
MSVGSEVNPVSDQAGLMTIQQVSRLLGVPTPTIRSWERRYGLPQASRTAAGHRRYSPEQVQALGRMRDAITRGHVSAEAANLAKTTTMRTQAAQPLIDALLDAAQQLEPDQITTILDAASRQLGLDATMDDVLLPAMRQIGDKWQTGRCNVAHEHLTTETVRAWLAHTAAANPARDARQPVILTCGPNDHHTLGLDAIGALLRRRGWPCRHLGASVPADSLAAAIRQVKPAAAVLVSHLPACRPAAVHALHAAMEALHTARLPTSRLYYAGNAFTTSEARDGAPGTYLGADLSEAADLITTNADDTTSSAQHPDPR